MKFIFEGNDDNILIESFKQVYLTQLDTTIVDAIYTQILNYISNDSTILENLYDTINKATYNHIFRAVYRLSKTFGTIIFVDNNTDLLLLKSFLSKQHDKLMFNIIFDIPLNNLPTKQADIIALDSIGANNFAVLDLQNNQKDLTTVFSEIDFVYNNVKSISGFLIRNADLTYNLGNVEYLEAINQYIHEKDFLLTILDAQNFDVGWQDTKAFDIAIIYKGNSLPTPSSLDDNIKFVRKAIVSAFDITQKLDVDLIRQIQQYSSIIYLYPNNQNLYYIDYALLDELLTILALEPDKITITAQGKVGINDLDPNSYLSVNGSLTLLVEKNSQDLTLGINNLGALIDASNNNIIVNLPSAAEAKGRIYFIKKIDTSPNAVVIQPSNNELIDGNQDYQVTQANESLQIQSDGNNQVIISGYGQGGGGGNVQVDNVTIEFDALGRLRVKDRGIDVNKLALNIDASQIGFNADMVDGFHVDDNAKTNALQTAQRIQLEAMIKALIFG